MTNGLSEAAKNWRNKSTYLATFLMFGPVMASLVASAMASLVSSSFVASSHDLVSSLGRGHGPVEVPDTGRSTWIDHGSATM